MVPCARRRRRRCRPGRCGTACAGPGFPDRAEDGCSAARSCAVGHAKPVTQIHLLAPQADQFRNEQSTPVGNQIIVASGDHGAGAAGAWRPASHHRPGQMLLPRRSFSYVCDLFQSAQVAGSTQTSNSRISFFIRASSGDLSPLRWLMMIGAIKPVSSISDKRRRRGRSCARRPGRSRCPPPPRRGRGRSGDRAPHRRSVGSRRVPGSSATPGRRSLVAASGGRGSAGGRRFAQRDRSGR